MKLKMTLAAMALVLIGSVAAQAQITLTLHDQGNAIPDALSTAAQPIVIAPGSYLFDGIYANVGLTGQDIDGISTPTAGIPGVTVTTPYDNPQDVLDLNLLPISIPGGQLFDDNGAFNVAITPAAIGQQFTLGVTYDSGAALSAVTFVVRSGSVPEPGSLALLAAGMVGGSAVLIRRRKK